MFEIYSEVRAILSSNVIGAIEGCVIDTIKECVFTASIEQVIADNEMQYELRGTLDGILIAKNKLEELINSLHIKRLAKEAKELDSTTFSEENSSLADEGNTSYDKEGTDKTSCLSDDKEQETNASSNGYVSTNTESSVRTMRPRPLSKKLRFTLKERPRVSQRTRSARLAMQLRTLKKKSIIRSKPLRALRNDPESLSENLQQMKLATEDSDLDSAGNDGKTLSPVRRPCKAKNCELVSAYKHYCAFCSFKTKRRSHFLKHLAIHEKVGKIYKCNQCSFRSMRLGHLRRHAIIHSSSVISCTDCSYKTDDTKLLLRHTKLKHSGLKRDDQNVTLVLSCPHCSYQTTKQHYYDRHQRLHCSKRTFLHQCEQCCYKTHRKEHFVRHVNNVHGDLRPYLCHICGKAFKRADALQQHHATHTEIPSENAHYKCSVCNKVFRTQSHLNEHQGVHSEFRSFLCEVCGASFKTRSVHRKHVQSLHRSPRSHTCDICFKKFNTLYTLKRHKKIHLMKGNHIVLPSATVETGNGISSTLTGIFAPHVESDVDDIPTTSSESVVRASTPIAVATRASGTDVLQPPLFQTSPGTATVLYLKNNEQQT